MPISLLHTPSEFKAFKNAAGQSPYQVTFKTPLKDLHPFVKAIVSAFQPIRRGRVMIDQVIFEPKSLIALLSAHSIAWQPICESKRVHDWSLQAAGDADVEKLLTATLAEWIDFAFVPTPKRLLVYADHDEFITFLSAIKSSISQIAKKMSELGL
jgi:hypothetical protein